MATARTQAPLLPRAARAILAEAPVSHFVYSSLSFYGPRHGGELPGTWLVAALESLDRSAAAVRQTLWRMERDGELESRRDGREKLYRLSPVARREAEAGTSKIFDAPAPRWDGLWTVVVTAFDGEERPERERLRAVLAVEGFGALAPGVVVHPRDRSARVVAAAEDLGIADRVQVFRATRLPGPADRAFVGNLWDLPALAREYRGFLHDFAPLARRSGGLAPRAAFAGRFAVVLRYLRAAWPDPELPGGLLPADWPGDEARALAASLYRRLLPGAIAFGDALAEP